MISYQIRYKIRQSLSGHALAAELAEFGHFKIDMPGREYFQSAFQVTVEAARRDDIASLTRDALIFFSEGRLKAFDVDVSNSQFFGAARYLQYFAFGYEPDILALLARFMPSGGIFFDVGANWGYFGLHLLLDPEFSGTVVAFEPVAQSFRDLKRMTDLLKLHHRMRCLRVALADVRGEMTISADIMSGLQSLASPVDAGEMVRVERMDNLDLPTPSLIKLDVENYEAPVLRGAKRILSTHRPLVIFESWLISDFQLTLAPFLELEQMGYKFYYPEFKIESELNFCLPCDVSGTLDLMPIQPLGRVNFPERINVLAIHESFQL